MVFSTVTGSGVALTRGARRRLVFGEAVTFGNISTDTESIGRVGIMVVRNPNRAAFRAKRTGIGMRVCTILASFASMGDVNGYLVVLII